MVGYFDRFCLVTGWRYMCSPDEVLDDISGVDAEEGVVSVSQGGDWVLSEEVRKGLLYNEHDIDATEDYVLITPCVIGENGELVVHRDPQVPKEFSEGTVTYVFNVVRSDRPECGIYEKCVSPEIEYGRVGTHSFLVNFVAFLIVQHLIPEMEAHVLYHLMTVETHWWGLFSKIDYGPVGRTHEESVRWRMVGDIKKDNRNDDGDDDDEAFELRWWLRLLVQEGKSDEEILKDAWMGPGNLWVFKHPGCFPIQRAVRLNESMTQSLMSEERDLQSSSQAQSSFLLCLPPELLKLILTHLTPEDALRFASTARILRRQFHLHLDAHTRAWVKRERPWYLPVGRINYERGNEETERWGSEWKRYAGLEVSDIERRAPWLAYYVACTESANIRSRERIWGIALQIKALAEARGLI